MSRLVWDSPGEKVFESGLDRGVLYATHQRGRVWNGLVSLSESEDDGTYEPRYQDGRKTYAHHIPGDYSATLEAYTYPAQLEQALGYQSNGSGFYVGNQEKRSFSFSYRTGRGNDLENLDYGYRIHIVYNAVITDDSPTRTTIDETLSPDLFSWTIATTPMDINGFRFGSHVIIDSRETERLLLGEIENTLYGRVEENARLLTPNQLLDLYENFQPTGYGHGLYGKNPYGRFRNPGQYTPWPTGYGNGSYGAIPYGHSS